MSNVNIKNRKASFNFEFIKEFTAGIKLTGSEIKSIREGKASIAEAFCYFKRVETQNKKGNKKTHSEIWVKGMHVAEYTEASYTNHEPYRERKLLLSKRELKKLSDGLKDNGLTIIIKRLFLKKGWVKLDIALAKGKKLYDKRQSIKDKDNKRDLDRKFKM